MGRAISPHSIDLSILSPTAQLTVVVFVVNYQFTIIRDFQNACVRSFVPRFFCLIVKIRLPWLPQIFSNRTDSGITSGTFCLCDMKKNHRLATSKYLTLFSDLGYCEQHSFQPEKTVFFVNFSLLSHFNHFACNCQFN